MSVKMVYTAHSHGEGAQHSKHVRRQTSQNPEHVSRQSFHASQSQRVRVSM
jgi:hypothetical protein